jgi:hypothetical protein
MVGKEPAYFDPETVTVLREILDEAWSRLPPERQAKMQKTAERILKSAARGERNRDRLRDAALTDLAA